MKKLIVILLVISAGIGAFAQDEKTNVKTGWNIGGVPATAREAGHPQHGLYDYKRYYGGKELMHTSPKIEIT